MQELQPRPPEKKSSKGIVIAIVVVATVFLAVPCIGVIAAVAIPAFLGYTMRAKTQEAESNLMVMFQGAAAYYAEEHAMPDGTLVTGCTVGTARTPNSPSSTQTVLSPPLAPSFDALLFSPADPVYYQYEIIGTGGCGHAAGETLYSFRAYGDLDGDGVTSLFEMSAGTNELNELYRSPGTYRENELE